MDLLENNIQSAQTAVSVLERMAEQLLFLHEHNSEPRDLLEGAIAALPVLLAFYVVRRDALLALQQSQSEKH